jgi:hypothetical protein
MSGPSVASPQRVIIANFANWTEMIRTNLTPRYQVTFGDLADADLAAYDAVIPLQITDYRRLLAHPELLERKFFHPKPETVALCDDKLRLNRFLIEHGFADFIPPLRAIGPPYPYIWKRRHGWWGSCQIVSKPEDEAALDPTGDGSFAQELVSGPREFATHLLRVRDTIRYTSTVVYDMARPVFVKGDQDRPLRTRFIPGCPWLGVFSNMLASLDYQGTACIDYKVTNEQPVVFEINPRFGGSLSMDITAYLDAYLEALRDPAGNPSRSLRGALPRPRRHAL